MDDLVFTVDTGDSPILRLLVTGDRNWTEWTVISACLRSIVEQSKAHDVSVVLMHGNCRGADKLAGERAEFLGIEVLKRPANWKRYGRAAGVVRNQEMLDEHKPHIVLAFHDDFGQSRGTSDCITRALKMKVPHIFHVNSTCKIRRVQ